MVELTVPTKSFRVGEQNFAFGIVVITLTSLLLLLQQQQKAFRF
jgi:hypothetical protein